MDFVRRYRDGEFGNHAPTWDGIDEFKDSNYRGLVHIRNRITGGPTWYDLPAEEVASRWCQLELMGHDVRSLYISGMAPTEKTLFQGEVQQSTKFLDLFYTTVAKPMRDALKERSEQVSGLNALGLLHYYLCPKSMEWLLVLLDRYPFHVIEFSTYGTEWGTLPGYNTVVWEVRMY